MKKCPETDALVTIGAALDWDVADGVRHLSTCDECRARLETLTLTHAAFAETEPVADAELAAIASAIGAAAGAERARTRRSERWAGVVEALVAATAAPVVLVSSGLQPGSVAAGALTCALGAALLLAGRRVRLDAI